MKITNWLIILLVSMSVLLSGCSQVDTLLTLILPPEVTPFPTPPPTATAADPTPTWPPFELTSSAFQPGESIPIRHTCHGEDLSPPLAWSEPPPGTQSLVLVMDDPDAVDVVGYIWDHWLLFNIPPGVLSLTEGLPADPILANGSHQGLNSFDNLGYGGPCPPGGQTHTYVFRLHALDINLDLEAGTRKADILDLIQGHILARAELTGTYTSP